MGHGAVFVNGHAQAFNRPRQATHQLRWVDRRDVGGIDAAIRLGNADLLGQLLRAEPAVVVFGEALGVQLVQIAAQAAFLLGVACGAIQGAAFAVVAVNAFANQHLCYFIRNAMQEVKRSATLLGGKLSQQTVFSQEVAHQPATIAPGCAETGRLRLDDCNFQLRGLALQVIGGPQAGIAGADNRHIDVQVVLQRRARYQRVVQLVHP
ncbi:hypothetical protein PFLmoz3_02816 [Pseudomonas fluorescens]|uniref:Uncharacterized protein n=1 Tax=Pseudomonas fluorescens TaxID=294 RepID=A0A109LH32_PSEFL|nr:hypothetical protein PFLmoz3_02816 [Pseudomonas fluorescens]